MGNNTGNRTSELENKIGKIGFSIRGKRDIMIINVIFHVGLLSLC